MQRRLQPRTLDGDRVRSTILVALRIGPLGAGGREKRQNKKLMLKALILLLPLVLLRRRSAISVDLHAANTSGKRTVRLFAVALGFLPKPVDP